MNARLTDEIAQRETTEAQLHSLSARLEGTRAAECQRLSRELHDQLGGALTGLKLDLARWRKRPSFQSADGLQVSDDLDASLDEMIRLVRFLATALRPPMLDDLGVMAALEWQLEDFQKRAGLECRLNAPDEPIELAAYTALAVFRVFQECLTNIARHAQATAVTVTVQASESDLYVLIHDNGRRVDTAPLREGESLGLLGMRERLRKVEGDLDIVGERVGGTAVAVRVPKATLRPRP